jgi:homoserine acetyltransferase
LLNRIAAPIEVPLLMLYANEDSLYPRARSEQYVESLRRKARKLEAQWLAAPSGHRFFAQSMPLWSERVDAFLDTCLAAARGQP